MSRAAVDDRLRTRRHLDCWASTSWAQDAAPVVDALAVEVAEPTTLATWMVRFSFEDQDFFRIGPVAYLDALGEAGGGVPA